MPRPKDTWQARGEYLADCCGLTATQFAAGIDTRDGGEPPEHCRQTGVRPVAPAWRHEDEAQRKTATAQTAGAAQ